MSDSETQILHEAPGQPTIIEVPLGFACIVFNHGGDLDLALIPGEDSGALEREEHTGDVMANGAMTQVANWLIAMQDPEVRALVQRKIDRDRPQA